MKLACVLVLACSSSCGTPECDVDCDDGVTIDLGPRATYGGSDKLNLHVCVGDDRCGDAVVTEHDCASVHADPTADAQLIISCAPNAELTVFAKATSPLGPGSQNVSVSVTDATGTKLTAATKSVATRPSHPNGPDCEPACHQGELSLRPQS